MFKLRVNEWQRTIVLVVLLLIGLGFILLQERNVQDNFVDTIETSQETTD